MGWKRKKLEAMGDEDLYDAHLVGTDGEEVPCCKAMLATTSPVFKSMFFRGFREQKKDRCTLEFHSLIISLIVKYCYCGELDIEDLIFNKDRPLAEEASLLVELREAGRYFEIEELSSTAETKIGNLVFQENNNKKKYQYATAILTELFKRGEDKEPLGLAIFQFAVKNAVECFGSRAPENTNSPDTDIYHTHPSVLSNVLEEVENIPVWPISNPYQYVVAKCIQTWASLESSKSADNCYSDEEKRALIKIAENTDLKKIPMGMLGDIKPSSFFPSERILEAFYAHSKSSKNYWSKLIDTTSIKRTIFHVSGAEMEFLNGFYKELRTCEGKNIFSKHVNHNGHICNSLIHRKNAENKWLISIGKYNIQLNNDDEVREDSIRSHVYESYSQLLPAKGPKVPPFNRWKCMEGTGPVPFVACIYHQY